MEAAMLILALATTLVIFVEIKRSDSGLTASITPVFCIIWVLVHRYIQPVRFGSAGSEAVDDENDEGLIHFTNPSTRNYAALSGHALGVGLAIYEYIQLQG